MSQTDDGFLVRRLGERRVGLEGELSFANAGSALRKTLAVLGKFEDDLVIDLAGVQRADSAGVALLIELVRAAGKRGIGLHFTNIPRQVQALAAVSGVNGLLPQVA